jgi:hypothetical protein
LKTFDELHVGHFRFSFLTPLITGIEPMAILIQYDAVSRLASKPLGQFCRTRFSIQDLLSKDSPTKYPAECQIGFTRGLDLHLFLFPMAGALAWNLNPE